MGVVPSTEPPLPYDAEVEYLKSDSSYSAFVDTGINPIAATFGVDIVFSLPGSSCPQRPFGCRSSSLAAGRGSYNVLFVTAWQCRIDMIGTSTWSVSMASGSTNRIVATPTGVTVNDAYTANVSSGKTDCPYSFYLFAINNAGSLWKETRGPLAISKSIIYDAGIAVRDFIPVRVGTLGYLYDRANPTGGPDGNGLYGNAASNNAGFPASCVGPDKA